MKIVVAVAAASLAALGATLALATPWSDRSTPRDAAPRALAERAVQRPERVAAEPARPAQAGSAPKPAKSARARRRASSRYPRVPASTDPLPRAGPIPAPPQPALVATLGRCCRESRKGARIDAIVVHATESPDGPGTLDLRRLARYFTRSTKSSHVADDAEGNSSRMVADGLMAYHATYWNQRTLGIEQVGYSSFARAQWLARPRQLEASARWIAFWARSYRIPIRRCRVAGIRYNRRGRVVAGVIVRRGVCSHAEVDPRNRDDPGPGYPWALVLARARAIAAAARG